MNEQELKQWYNELVAKEQEFLERAAALRSAQRETFSMIYGFPLDVRLCATEEILNEEMLGENSISISIDEVFEIESFNFSDDTFTISDGEFTVSRVPLDVIRRMIY